MKETAYILSRVNWEYDDNWYNENGKDALKVYQAEQNARLDALKANIEEINKCLSNISYPSMSYFRTEFFPILPEKMDEAFGDELRATLYSDGIAWDRLAEYLSTLTPEDSDKALEELLLKNNQLYWPFFRVEEVELV